MFVNHTTEVYNNYTITDIQLLIVAFFIKFFSLDFYPYKHFSLVDGQKYSTTEL